MHGGIDGFSRLIVFLDCVANNTANAIKSKWGAQYFPVTGDGLPVDDSAESAKNSSS